MQVQPKKNVRVHMLFRVIRSNRCALYPTTRSSRLVAGSVTLYLFVACALGASKVADETVLSTICWSMCRSKTWRTAPRGTVGRSGRTASSCLSATRGRPPSAGVDPTHFLQKSHV